MRPTVFEWPLLQPFHHYCRHAINSRLHAICSYKALKGSCNVPCDDTWYCAAWEDNPTGAENFVRECNQTTCSKYAKWSATGGTDVTPLDMSKFYMGRAGFYFTLYWISDGEPKVERDYEDGIPGLIPLLRGAPFDARAVAGNLPRREYSFPRFFPYYLDQYYNIVEDVAANDLYKIFDVHPQKKKPVDGTLFLQGVADGAGEIVDGIRTEGPGRYYSAGTLPQRRIGPATVTGDADQIIAGSENDIMRPILLDRRTLPFAAPADTVTVETPEQRVVITKTETGYDIVLTEAQFSGCLDHNYNREKSACKATIKELSGDTLKVNFDFGFVNVRQAASGEGVVVKYATPGNVVQPRVDDVI